LGSRVEWRATLAQARRDEPGLREAIYVNDQISNPEGEYYLEALGESGRYLYSELTDDDLNVEVDWSVPFSVWSGLEASVKVGGAYRDRERDFAARRFNWQFLSGLVTDIDGALTDETIVGQARRPNQFAISDIVEPGDQYQAFDKRSAGYLMLDLPLTSSVRSIVGARVEKYDLAITSREEDLSGLEEMDVLPAVNLIVDLNRDMVVRAGFSQTLDRPEFRELAPFQFTEAASLRQIVGNPDLEVATIRSADLRWDWFPRAGEVFSISGFYKQLTKPIEQVFIAAASTAYSYQNAQDGWIAGLEFDIRRRLDFIADPLFALTFIGNLSVVESEVNVIETGNFLPTNLQRPLEGQSSYSVNVGLMYSSLSGATELGAFYNRFGDRLRAAGGFGVPDIVERPRNQLDASVKQQLYRGLRLKAKASNLLNEAVVYEQEANGITQVQRQYKTGVTFSFGMSFDL
jgi:TonB-dependent receptor